MSAVFNLRMVKLRKRRRKLGQKRRNQEILNLWQSGVMRRMSLHEASGDFFLIAEQPTERVSWWRRFISYL